MNIKYVVLKKNFRGFDKYKIELSCPVSSGDLITLNINNHSIKIQVINVEHEHQETSILHCEDYTPIGQERLS